MDAKIIIATLTVIILLFIISFSPQLAIRMTLASILAIGMIVAELYMYRRSKQSTQEEQEK